MVSGHGELQRCSSFVFLIEIGTKLCSNFDQHFLVWGRVLVNVKSSFSCTFSVLLETDWDKMLFQIKVRKYFSKSEILHRLSQAESQREDDLAEKRERGRR